MIKNIRIIPGLFLRKLFQQTHLEYEIVSPVSHSVSLKITPSAHPQKYLVLSLEIFYDSKDNRCYCILRGAQVE